jgi:hypothetical protein
MRRSSVSVSAAQAAAQIPLGLEPAADPASESALRAAYRRLELSRRLAFEQALSDRAYAIGIRNLAEATARRINHPARGRKTH